MVNRRTDQYGGSLENRMRFGLEALEQVRRPPQAIVNNGGGAYRLFRVGDAVANRTIHAAIYNSLRLCNDL